MSQLKQSCMFFLIFVEPAGHTGAADFNQTVVVDCATRKQVSFVEIICRCYSGSY